MDIRLHPSAIKALRDFQARLAKIPAAYERLEKRFLTTAGRIARLAFRAQIRSSGAEFGLPFAPLAAATLRGRRGRARRPLVGTGKLIQDVGRASNTRVAAGVLTLRTTARTRTGRRLVPLHEIGGPRLPVRRIVAPSTGIAGASLAKIERGWVEVGEALAREGNGLAGPGDAG